MIKQVLAESINNPVINNPATQVGDPTGYFNSVIQTVFSIFFIVGIIYFIWHFIMAGYHYIASEGDPKKIETAKSELSYSIVGVLVVFSVFAILKFVGFILGIEGLNALSVLWPNLL